MIADIVIAGAGPAGLSAAIELGRRGIRVIVLERLLRDTYRGPRTYLINNRSMEHLRRWGIAEQLRERNPIDPEMQPDVIFATRLNGHLLHRFERPFVGNARAEASSENAQWIPQRAVEETLIDLIGSLPTVTLLWGHELTGFSTDNESITCEARTASGDVVGLSAQYLIGADGSHSLVRKRLGIRMQGRGNMLKAFVYHVRVPQLKQLSKVGLSSFYWFINGAFDGYSGVIINAMREGEFSIGSFPSPPGIDPEDPDDIRQVIHEALGAQIPIEIISGRSYNMHGIIAPEMQRGRVLIAGDAAHLLPNLGGFGFNVGLLDGVDAGWKLAYMLKGWGGERLLRSYEIERHEALAWVAKIQIGNVDVLSHDIYMPGLEDDGEEGIRLRDRVSDIIIREKTQEFHSLGTQKGYRLTTSPVIMDDGSAPAPTHPTDYIQTSRPGALAPHAWLSDGSSLYDHFGPEFTLAVKAPFVDLNAAIETTLPLTILELRDGTTAELYSNRFTLIRPDQMVAWSGDSVAELSRIMAYATGEDRSTQ